jgi:dTDP-4-amino-4,6-dideoxygalactose transaminase
LAQGPDKGLQQRLERLEGMVQEQRRLLENYEQEMKQLKSELKKQHEAIDEKVQAASKKPEHKELLREIMSDLRLTEAKETSNEKEIKTIYDEWWMIRM